MHFGDGGGHSRHYKSGVTSRQLPLLLLFLNVSVAVQAIHLDRGSQHSATLLEVNSNIFYAFVVSDSSCGESLHTKETHNRLGIALKFGVTTYLR